MQRIPELGEVILVPLYPHYAMSSYETAAEYAKEIHSKKKYSFKLSIVEPFYENADYINALTESIRPFMQSEFDHLLFSYHGIPERHVHKTDITGNHCLMSADCCATPSPAHVFCYRHQIITTTNLVAKQLQLPKEKFSFSFQSRLGRDEWLKPYTAMRLEEMPAEGIKKLIIVCPAFVSDCLETLEEIAERGKETFKHARGESYTMIPCMNTHPMWVNAITKWLKEYATGNQQMILA